MMRPYKIIFLLLASISLIEEDANAQALDCTSISNYASGASYTAGSQVKNNGTVYQCRPWPNSGWCSGNASFYQPGVGSSWQDAWTIIGGCADQLPLIVINAPLSAQVFNSFAPITLQATISPQNGGAITTIYMELYKDGGSTPYATVIPGFPNGTVTTFNWSPSENGVYLLKVYAINEKNFQSTQTVSFAITGATGVMAEKAGQMILYPNPTSEGVEIKLPEHINPQAISSISVSDVFGSLIFTSSTLFSFRDETLKLTPGVYVVSVTAGEYLYTSKFVKQ